MSSQEDPVVVVCFRVADKAHSDIDGATKDRCAFCNSEVWISPATRRVKEEKDGTTVCFHCVGATMTADVTEPPKLVVHKTQLEEIAEQLDRDKKRDIQKN